MELSCIHSPTLGSIPRSVLSEKQFSRGPASLKLPAHIRTCPGSRNPRKFLDFRTLPSGTFKIKSQAQDSTLVKNDENLVFVAGATGKVGSRTVRELLKQGFSVRGGVRSIQRAKSLVQSVENMKLEDVKSGAKPIDNFELVECDLEKPEQIRPALGNSSIVICCIGASEKEIFDITGPYRIDFQATKNLIDAATSAKIKHFILLTSLGTNKVGFPAAILNLFWGVLCWKRKAEEALLASGVPYTIVRPGGMERPTDSFKETHNITLSEEDTLFGGQVSNLQVAELIAFMAKNRSLSYCKVVEVIAETSAPLTPVGDLLEKIPSQRKEIRGFKESDDLDGSKSVVQDSATSSTEKKPEQISEANMVPKTKHASSPYVNYEDLKPPSSPTPTPSGSKKEPSSVASTSDETEVTLPVTGENNDVAKKEVLASSSQSPYLAYESLKPPSSPSPSAPVLAGNDKPIDDKVSGNIDTDSESKGRPLSPYAMYEDLKPPGLPRKL